MYVFEEKFYKTTGIIEDLNDLLAFLYDESCSDNPRSVYLISGEHPLKISLDDNGLFFVNNGSRYPYIYRMGDIFKIYS